ncbi:MAG: SH3 domain-containing protein [Gemmatimonadota bacterium]
MSRLSRLALALVVIVSALAHPVAAQERGERSVVIQEATSLYERPDGASRVEMTLPAGMAVQLVTEQGGWWAVSISTELSGWIRAPGVAEPQAAETPAVWPPAATNPDSSRAAPPPARSAPPPARSAPPPPPPSAAGVGQSGGAGAGRDVQVDGRPVGGLYESHSWRRLHYDVQESVQAAGFQYGRMMNQIGEFEVDLVGARTSFSGADDLWSLDLRFRYRLYALQPTDELPVGAYGAALGAFQRFFPSEGEGEVDLRDSFFSPMAGRQSEAAGRMTRDGSLGSHASLAAQSALPTLVAATPGGCACASIHENVARVGGEGGVFGRIRTEAVTVIPRVGFAWNKVILVGAEETDGGSFNTLVLGAEVLFGRFAPSLYLSRTQEVNLFSLGIALPGF